MPTLDHTFRRLAVARAVLGIIQRERPDSVQQLRTRVWEVLDFRDGSYLNDETSEVVAAWCNDLHLGCEAIQSAALGLALRARYDPRLGRDEPSVDDDGNVRYYYIPWIPGESKRAFLIRAEAHFDREKKAEIASGSIAASDRINPKHLEWLVRFQVNGEAYEHIATTDRADRRDVTREIKAAADLLVLELRTAKRGRPKGSGHPIDKNSPHRRKSSRR